MTNTTARRQARRFWGTMGAALRRTGQVLDNRRVSRGDIAIRPAYGFVAIKADARRWRGS